MVVIISILHRPSRLFPFGLPVQADINLSTYTQRPLMAMLPPVAVVVLMQRWFIKGLTETEK